MTFKSLLSAIKCRMWTLHQVLSFSPRLQINDLHGIIVKRMMNLQSNQSILLLAMETYKVNKWMSNNMWWILLLRPKSDSPFKPQQQRLISHSALRFLKTCWHRGTHLAHQVGLSVQNALMAVLQQDDTPICNYTWRAEFTTTILTVGDTKMRRNATRLTGAEKVARKRRKISLLQLWEKKLQTSSGPSIT